MEHVMERKYAWRYGSDVLGGKKRRKDSAVPRGASVWTDTTVSNKLVPMWPSP